MGFWNWLTRAPQPSKANLTNGPNAVSGSRALWEQYGRIGGSVSPTQVTNILRDADGGRPARLLDLGFEARQKDGHLQSVLGTRDRAVALSDLQFIEPDDASAKEKKALDTCQRCVDEFENFEDLVETLTSAYWSGFSTVEAQWRMSRGALLPFRAAQINPRFHLFNWDGELRYSRGPGDAEGVDILAENPGRILQIQRRITGDIPAREGLLRVLTWAALFRNWDLRDWIALGEIGWKPWRLATYPAGTHQDDVDKLLNMLENIGASGVGAYEEGQSVEVTWPKGQSTNKSTHGELFSVLGQEISKAVLGQTTSVEAGPNGDRGGVQARDQLRQDIHESDARAVAACLYFQLFRYVVELNHPGARTPALVFQTEDGVDGLNYSQMVKNLNEAGVRIAQQEIRDELGFREPEDDEEVIGVTAPVPDGLDGDSDESNPDDDGGDEDEGEDDEDGAAENKSKAPSGPTPDGQEYADRISDETRRLAASEMTGFLAPLISEIQAGASYEEIQHRILEVYRDQPAPLELAKMVEAALAMAQLGGHLEESREL